MSKLLKINNRVSNAKNFRVSLSKVDPTPEQLYLFFGRDLPWPDENAPDAPTEGITEEFATRDAMIGIKKITETNTALVTNRYTWQTGIIYAEYDAADSSLFSKQFYVITGTNSVYKCLSNGAGATSVIEPTGTSTSPVATGDGYTWKFMYDLSSSMISNFLTTDWLPIPQGGQRTAFQIAVENNAVYTIGDPSGGHGSHIENELAASRVMIEQTLDKDESGLFPINDDYRQFGLWENPLLISTGLGANGATYSVNDTNTDIDSTSGTIQYIDNRKAIARSSEQAESFKLVMSF